MKKLTTKQRQIIKAANTSKGRFFGLETKNGEVFNAQFRGETPQFLTVFDRNYGETYRVKKTNLAHFKLGSTEL